MAAPPSAEQPPAAPPGPDAETVSWQVRLRAAAEWIQQNRWSAGIAVGSALLLLGAGSILAWWLMPPVVDGAPEPTLADALEKLDAGKFAEAKAIARQLSEKELPDNEWGGPAFVFGAAIAREAPQAIDPRGRRHLYEVAARYLKEAHRYGYPQGYEAPGRLLLAESLIAAGQYPTARKVLRQGLDYKPWPLAPWNRLLAISESRLPDPDFAAALAENQEWLDADLSPEQRRAARFQRIDLLLRSGNLPEAGELLDQFTDEPDDATWALLQGRWTLARLAASDEPGNMQRDELLEAAARFRRIAINEDARPVDQRQAAYWLAVAHRSLGDLNAAVDQYERTRKVHFGQPEELAAGLDEGELLLDLQRPGDAVSTLKRALRVAGRRRPYTDPILPLSDLRQRVLRLHQRLLRERQHEAAIQLAALYYPIYSLDEARRLEAEAHVAFAEHCDATFQAADSAQWSVQRTAALNAWQATAAAYERLAEARLTMPEYTDDLWDAGNAYLKGGQYREAIGVLRKYLDNELTRRVPSAMVRIAEAELALGRRERGLGWLSDCLRDWPEHPASFQARLLAAKANLQSDEGAAAKELLLENLRHPQLTPDSIYWRDSLFQLARLLSREAERQDLQARMDSGGADSGRLLKQKLPAAEQAYAVATEALKKLREYVARYPEGPDRAEALYLIAETQRQAARLPQLKHDMTTIATTRSQLRESVREHLRASAEAYARLQEDLNARGHLTPVQSAMLRNCYFAQGNIAYLLGDPQAAIEAYTTATNRYQNEPASLEAYVQIARCYRKLDQPLEARVTLVHAMAVLKKLPAEAKLVSTTRLSRNEWEDLLEWMSKAL